MKTRSKALEDDAFPLESLPDGILALVVDHLSGAADKKALRRVCRRLRALVDSKVSKIELPSLYVSTPSNLDEVAARWPALRVLHLPGLPSAAGPALARATCASLEELGFSYEKIAEDAVMALAVAMTRMPNLRALDCSCTHLSDAGVQALAQVKCPSLEAIDLRENDLGQIT